MKQNTIVTFIQKFFAIIVGFSIVFELILFPTIENFYGCIMTATCYFVFSLIIKNNDVIVFHPFSFLAYFQMFLAHVIPLPATLLEGHPISYGFEYGEKTFILETIMYLTCSMAFFCSINFQFSKKNGVLSKIFYKMNMFYVDKRVLWCLGGIGTVTNIYSLVNRFVTEYGDIGGKFIAGLSYLQYAPIILLFPSLSNINVDKKGRSLVVYYVILVFVLSLMSNSRQAMIYPIFTIMLLFMLYVSKENKNIFSFFSTKVLVFGGVGVYLMLSLFSSLSDAMLEARRYKKEVSRADLFQKTLDFYFDSEVDSEPVVQNEIATPSKMSSYSRGWTEDYIDNFMLNRFGNMRVSDETLYYADRIRKNGKDQMMRATFYNRILYIFPTPFLKILSINIDKKTMEFSPGDYLYLLGSGTKRFALGGYRVTSLVGDGMANFGYYCFPIVFFLLFLSFKLLDSFVFIESGRPMYALLGLIGVFTYFGCFRNSIGCVNIISFLIRNFVQQCFTFLLVVNMVRLVLFKSAWR